MSKSIVYAVNSATQTVAEGGSVNWGNVVRRYGCNCNVANNNAVINGTGYYRIDVNLTLVGTAAGNAIVSLYKNNVAIPGAIATMPTTVGSINSITIPCVVRDTCCCSEDIITAIISGEGADVSNAAILMQKL